MLPEKKSDFIPESQITLAVITQLISDESYDTVIYSLTRATVIYQASGMKKHAPRSTITISLAT